MKVLKVTGQGANCIRFYITFEAKDLAEAVKCQMKMLYGLAGGSLISCLFTILLASFRCSGVNNLK